MDILDTETHSPDPDKPDWALDPRRTKLDLIGVASLGPHSPICIYGVNALEALPPPDFFRNSPGFCGHNFKYDFKVLHWNGYLIEIEQYAHDTLVMSSALMSKVPEEYIAAYEKKRRELNAGLPAGQSYRPAKKHSLKLLAPFFLGCDAFWENTQTTNDPEYLRKDVEYTRGLFDHFVPMMKNEGVWEFYNDRLMPWARMLLQAELEGISINLEAMNHLKAQAEAGMLNSHAKLKAAWANVEDEWKRKCEAEVLVGYDAMLIKAMEKIKPEKTEEKTQAKRNKTALRYKALADKALSKIEPFNYGSSEQLAWALRDQLGYNITNMEGDETTGASTLEILAAQGKDDIKALLEYKSEAKIVQSYFPSYLEHTVNGRINCSYNMFPRTGRLSCSRVNLQQVPPRLKEIFQPEPGNNFVAQDLSAIEVVLIAYYTEDETLCRIIMEGLDFHGVATVDFFELDMDPQDVKTKCPEMRYAAKQGDLSLFYGSGKNRLFTTLTLNGIKAISGKPLTPQLCAKMVYRFRDRFHQAWEFKEMLDAELSGGNAVTNLFGRRFNIPDKANVYMQGLNTLIQGSASDLLLQGTHDCLAELKASGIWAAPRLFVHDQAVLECHSKDAEYVNARLIHHLTKFKLATKHGIIPLKTEGGHGQNWE